jgi:hypothetical protein
VRNSPSVTAGISILRGCLIKASKQLLKKQKRFGFASVNKQRTHRFVMAATGK